MLTLAVFNSVSGDFSQLIIFANSLDSDQTTLSIWASSQKKKPLGFPTKPDSNQSLQLQRLARKAQNSEISFVASLYILLSKK